MRARVMGMITFPCAQALSRRASASRRYRNALSATAESGGRPIHEGSCARLSRRTAAPVKSCPLVEGHGTVTHRMPAAIAAGIRCVTVPCPSTRGQDFTGAAVRLDSLAQLPSWMGLPPDSAVAESAFLYRLEAEARRERA